MTTDLLNQATHLAEDLSKDDLHAIAFEERASKQAKLNAANAAIAQARISEAFSALEEMLILLYPKVPIEPLMLKIKRRFVSPSAFFEAPAHLIEDIGIKSSDALLLTQIPGISRYAEKNAFGERPLLSSLTSMSSYLMTRYRGLAIEHFYLLSLDASGRLIDCTLLQRGTTDSTPFYLRHVLMEVVRTQAHAIVISHNHPSFSARPSQADINCTIDLLSALQPVGALLLDHIIVSNKESVSIRQYGFVRTDFWINQAPDDPLMRKWLGDQAIV